MFAVNVRLLRPGCQPTHRTHQIVANAVNSNSLFARHGWKCAEYDSWNFEYWRTAPCQSHQPPRRQADRRCAVPKSGNDYLEL